MPTFPGAGAGARRARHAVAAFTCFVAALCASVEARGSELQWDPRFRRVGVPEYVATGALAGAYLVMAHVVPPAEEPLFISPALMDRQVRDAMRSETRSSRQTAATVSDYLNYGLMAHVVIADNLAVVGLVHRNEDVAGQMFVINAQSYALTLALSATAKRLTARQRPYAAACAEDPDYIELCENADRFRSFFSGHAAQSATSAGLLCAHHLHLPLYGRRWADYATCGVAASLAMATGTLRVVSDRHYTTDVLVGLAIGAGSGFVLPTLLYYGADRARPSESTSSAAMPLVFSYGGQF